MSAKEIASIYDIEEYSSTVDFLLKIARKMGKLAKGGVADLKAAAKLIVEDWNKGKIKYYTPVPSEY